MSGNYRVAAATTAELTLQWECARKLLAETYANIWEQKPINAFVCCRVVLVRGVSFSLSDNLSSARPILTETNLTIVIQK